MPGRPSPPGARGRRGARSAQLGEARARACARGARQELDAAFREVLGNEWTIKSDERVKYVGKLEVEQDNTTLKVGARALAAGA